MRYSVNAITRDYINRDGKAALCIRITINRKVKYYPINIKIDPKDFKAGKAIGRSDFAYNTNMRIRKELNHFEDVLFKMSINNVPVSFKNIEKSLKGNEEKDKKDFFAFANESIKNFDVSSKTKQHYRSFLNTLSEFQSAIQISDINLDFIEKYNLFLKNKGLMQNTIWGHHKRMKKFINRAITLEVISKNPYQSFKVKTEQTTKTFLNKEEVEMIEKAIKKNQMTAALNNLASVFLFSCYTGLRYSDIKGLKWKDITTDNQLYLRTEKAKKVISFPLSSRAIKHLPIRRDENEAVFYIMCNQKANQYLKVIASHSGINKNLTYHASRHTFATISLTLGIPLKVIQSILGHSSMKTTEIYAKIVDELVNNEMNKWDY